MQKKPTKKSRFQPIFDYMDERFAKIEADIVIIKERMDMFVVHMEQSEKRWQADERRWQENSRRFNQHMEILERHSKQISLVQEQIL